ncbi:MAG: flavodoxin domain-containing protein [Candidatus Heimdallarchaeaceae archaeon]
MSEKRLLILYGTRFGATEGVVGKMVELSKNKEVVVDVFNLKDLPEDKIPPFDQYSGILVGSGIKIGQWTKDVKRFIINKRDDLNSFKGKKGFFVCSGYASLPEMYEQIKLEYTKEACEKLGVKMDFYDAFGGLIDFTETSHMGWLEKKLIKIVSQQNSAMKVDTKGYNDLRDWEKIKTFTLNFVNSL